MPKSGTLIVAAVLLAGLLAGFVSAAVAYTYPGSPNCPWANPRNTWAKFLNREYGDQKPVFSIQFKRNISHLEAGRCYTMVYHGNENWETSGKIGGMVPHTSKVATVRGGDPSKYQLNVWGAQFTYNEAGEVIYVPDGKLAGNMYCHRGSECWK